jgi:transcriptional regulator with XRE-family HTH domain
MPLRLPNPHDVAIGQKLRSLRNVQKMSQDTLGKHLGLTFQQVQKYEKGVNRLSGSRLIQLAQLFNVSVDELCAVPDGVSPKSKRDDVITRLASTPVGVELAEAWDSIKSPKVRRVAADLVVTMASLANGIHQNGHPQKPEPVRGFNFGRGRRARR